MNNASISEDTNFKECFDLQLSEIEMLSSMYPQEREFSITIPSVLVDMNRFIQGKTKQIPNEIDYTLTIDIEDVQDKLEVNVILPHDYPHTKPLVYVRSNGLHRTQQRQLNSAISNYIDTLPPGELYSITLINWLTENSASYFTSIPNKTEMFKSPDLVTEEPNSRIWIYSHHIYNKHKRREIIDSANDLNLTGFSLPGKPGFICAEGAKRNCSEFLQIIRHMTWKKISLVKEEIEDSNVEGFKKFDTFREISFQVRRGPAKEYHMDMGQFLKYLEEHSCAYVFQDLFGIQGHTSTEK